MPRPEAGTIEPEDVLGQGGSVSSKTVINDGEGGLMRDLRCLKILISRKKKGLNIVLKKRQKSAFIQMVKPFTKETEDSYKTKQF